MSILRRLFGRWSGDEVAVTAIEYALIAALIALGVVAGAMSIGTSLSGTFSGIAPRL